jgi:hypothetical protein
VSISAKMERCNRAVAVRGRQKLGLVGFGSGLDRVWFGFALGLVRVWIGFAFFVFFWTIVIVSPYHNRCYRQSARLKIGFVWYN